MEELGDGLGAALVRNNLAYTLVSLGDFDAALEASLSALRYVEDNQLPYAEMSVLDTVASAYLAIGDLDTATDCAQRGLALARKNGSQRDETDNLVTLGRLLLERHADVCDGSRSESVLCLQGHRLHADWHEGSGRWPP